MTVRGYIAVGDDILQIKNVLNGPQRSFIPVTGGSIKGVGPAEGLEAEISPASSDGVLTNPAFWLLIGSGLTLVSQMNPSTNTAHLNVRLAARSSAGAAIFVQYQGILKVDKAGGKVLSGAPDAKSTEYGEQEWFISPLIETSDERLKWMEESVWVGQGHWIVDGKGSAVEYQVYRLAN
ncbi:hypothetical protein G647_07312 [Cladophialophora carrionii CBS 160.54]|uniref:DUF3237 domain-containing protein n=1 Tax=Cladophialophora carrionii CBS 160.54 TaxID=1279043 RepID=V9D226_9EURO|nr:uncharacterized protein G647_07312 [Cladophialophora carrionii CBS 160.54]ETI20969.1 hypothetical protein G647_07312 [Cladophialophora carrionii CBS 160.54]